MTLDHSTDFDAYGPQSFTMSAYVVIDLETDTIYDIGFEKGGTSAAYQGSAEEWADANINGLTSSGVADIVIPKPVDHGGPIGATYSAAALKEAIAKAYEIYASENV